jgi:ubiquinone/menaquinone biosynthesis C-methylase UbiE
MARKKSAKRSHRVLLNAGCGSLDDARLPRLFSQWRQIRVDVDPSMKPDVVASVADLSAIPNGTVDAVWSAHCLEHLFAYQVPKALAEFRRVLSETGFACIIVPDLQAIAHWIATDRLHETIYQSAAGPITAHDMVWGFGPAIARGKTAMAHRCGFTPTLFLECLKKAGFAEIVLRRRKSSLELAALALRQPSAGTKQRQTLMAELGL